MALPHIGKDIRDFLLSKLLIIGITDPVSVGDLTATPVNQFGVFTYPGHRNTRSHGGGNIRIDRSRVQIMYRNSNPSTVYTNINLVADILDDQRDITINGNLYLWMHSDSPPRMLDRDATGAVIYIWEFDVEALVQPSVYTDTFVRADSTSLGANWGVIESQTGQLRIASNLLLVGGNSLPSLTHEHAIALWNAIIDKNQFSKITLKRVNVDLANQSQVGAWVRATNNGTTVTGYEMVITIIGTNQVALYLGIVTDSYNANITYPAHTAAFTAQDGDVYGIQAQDNIISLTKNGTVIPLIGQPNGVYVDTANTFPTGQVGLGSEYTGDGTEAWELSGWSGGGL